MKHNRRAVPNLSLVLAMVKGWISYFAAIENTFELVKLFTCRCLVGVLIGSSLPVVSQPVGPMEGLR